MTDTVKVLFQMAPGAREEIHVASGASVEEAVKQSRFHKIDLRLYLITIDGLERSPRSPLLDDSVVVLTRGPKGGNFTYKTPQNLMIYFAGSCRRGVRGRREAIEEFKKGLNTAQRNILTVEETDVSNRTCFLEHCDFLDQKSVNLIVYEMKDIKDIPIRPYAIKVPTIVVSEFNGVADATDSVDAFWHYQEIRDRLMYQVMEEKHKRKESQNDVKQKSDGITRRKELWQYVKTIIDADDCTICKDEHMADQLLEKHGIEITASRLSALLIELDKNEDGSRKGIMGEYKRKKNRNKKRSQSRS
jgi:hypothetical protein